MTEDLKKLYSGVIRAHNESPVNFRRETGKLTLKAYNPLCGDRFEIYPVSLDEGGQPVLKELSFHGFGCSISRASSSVMVQSLAGKHHADALRLCDQFLRFLDNESATDPVFLDSALAAFSGVHEFPERKECAALPWREMKKYLSMPPVK